MIISTKSSVSKESSRQHAPLSAKISLTCICENEINGIAINKYNAITLKAGDILSVKNAILKLASDKGLRKKLGKNSRAIVESDMEKKNIFKEYFLIYNN